MFDYKEATPVQLAQIAAEGDAMGFNRQIAEWVISELDPTCVLLVCPRLIHEHAQGVKIDPHLRTEVYFRLKNGDEGTAFVDMTFKSFNRLPKLKLQGSNRKSQETTRRLREAVASVI